MPITLSSTPTERDAEVAARSEPLPSPRALAAQCPLPDGATETVRRSRRAIQNILRRDDERFVVVVGPCSIHDADAALAYAARLARVQDQLGDRLLFVMRVYMEKPRTTTGWRGMVNDPHLDGTFAMADGLRRARRLFADILALGLPIATEMLDLSVPAYLADLVSFAGIGARTTESQPHRALASSLAVPVGFKNGTDGGLQTALDALVSAGRPHSFIGIDEEGRSCAVRTSGNADCVLILRGGGKSTPNYHVAHIAEAERRLHGLEMGRPPAILVDCSHANSRYDPTRQGDVCREIAAQRRSGSHVIRGLMLESNLLGGKQPLIGDGSDRLQYGVSVTDACLGWPETEALLRELHGSLG